jgi:hypothetical protein
MTLARRTLFAAIVALVVFAAAFATPTASGTAGQRSSVIRLISIPGRTVERDLPPKGAPNKGDSLSGTSTLRNAVAQFEKPKGAVVGSDSYSITLTAPPRALVKARVKLPGGTLRLQGEASLAVNVIKVPVVGGTGAFAGARGTSAVSELSGGRSLNVYRLRIP